ncbi:MAG: HDOD domain-containing protein [Elusimicrobia bacterium]|nr:MAG: HDOD domain-containing protein [Elusimicrobiota bacterium]
MNSPDRRLTLDADSVINGVRRLPSLPAVIVELLHSLDDEHANARRLARDLARDPALAARILRTANSSFYGCQRKVLTLDDAFAVLGLQGVRSLAIAATMRNTLSFRHRGSPGEWNFNAFWRHSVAVALAARGIAQCYRSRESHAFAAGLLHDVGRLALASCFPEHAAAVVRARTADDESWLPVEQRVLGIDHASIGRVLAEHWQFPKLLTQTIGSHHAPDPAADDLVSLVHVADWLGHAVERTRERHRSVGAPPGVAGDFHPLAADEWTSLAETVAGQLDAACAAFTT